MRAALLGLVFVSPPFLKVLLLKWFCGAKIGRRARIGWFSAVMGRKVELGEHSIIRPFTLISVTGTVSLGDYGEISSFSLVYGSASLIVGDHSYVGPQSLINVDEEVRLGRQSALGPRCMVFTHGSFLPYIEGYWVKLAGVTIGDRVWCAAGVFIHPGVEIGNNSFVNARSVLTQSVPAGSVVEGNPARVVYPMERMKRKMSPRRVDGAVSQLLRDFTEIGLRRELGIEIVEEAENELRFRWRGESYRIALIPSAGDPPLVGEADSGVRQILVVNRPDWLAPPGAAVFDLATGQTPFDSGHIHSALRLFMQRYYGIRFSDRALAQRREGSG
jgi:acetyltransferase-like isoleucine patch superfamily enzyme